jgi:transposase-like protein
VNTVLMPPALLTVISIGVVGAGELARWQGAAQ